MEVFADVVEDIGLGCPSKNGKSEGAFGDEVVAFHGFEWGGDAVIVEFIVPRNDPNFALMLESDLRGTGYVSGGMKGNVDAVDADGLAEGKGLEGDVLTETEFQDVFVALGGEVVFVVGSGVISMCVGDEGFVDGFVGIYVDIGGGAVEAGWGGY